MRLLAVSGKAHFHVGPVGGMSWTRRTQRRFDDPLLLAPMAKDIDIALEIANDAGLDIPLARIHQALWHDRYFINICRSNA